MLYSLNSHFNGIIGEEGALQIAHLAYDICRADAQPSSVELMLEMCTEIHTAGMIPHIVVGSYEQIEALPDYAICSWKNEPDIALGRPIIPAWVYVNEFKVAAEVANRSPVGRIGGPVCSNLNKRGFAYLEEFLKLLGGYPENTWCDMHRYGDGTFNRPHYDLRRWIFSRRAEYLYLKRIIGVGVEWGISEVGYPSDSNGVTEAQQAERLKQEFVLATEEGASFMSVYQRADGPRDIPIERFGIRHCAPDGTLTDLKPSAFIVRQLKGIA